MSEDDTYNKLRQIPLRQMMDVVVDFWRYDQFNHSRVPDHVFEKYGWTITEYQIEFNKIREDDDD